MYNLAVAQAQRIDVGDDRITFTFAANQNVARMQLEQNREWLEALVMRVAGRHIPVAAAMAEATAATRAEAAAPPPADAGQKPGRDLKAEAMSSSAVQAMLDVFPAEIRDVEEM